MVVHSYNPSTLEAETGVLKVQGQPKQYSETLSKKGGLGGETGALSWHLLFVVPTFTCELNYPVPTCALRTGTRPSYDP
jgi:hypothetical protein